MGYTSGMMAGILAIIFLSLRIFFTDAWYRSKASWGLPWASKLSAHWKRATPEDMVLQMWD
jgi:hypothetical protein